MAPGSAQTDRDVLLHLYNTTGGKNWTHQEGWAENASDLGSWFGVTVNGEGRVEKLQLQVTVTNEKPFSKRNVGINVCGPIPTMLGKLDALRTLDLSGNGLVGSIPRELGQLAKLRYLNLSWNLLDGPIPPELGDLAALEEVHLTSNELTGVIPRELCKLPALLTLNIACNQLTGQIPREVGKLSALTSMHLQYNSLTGPIPPEVGNLTALEKVHLQYNDLTGPIPSELGKLVVLEELNLRKNELTGRIPLELGKLVALENLNLDGNELSGSIPLKLNKLVTLEELGDHANELTGSFPQAARGEAVSGPTASAKPTLSNFFKDRTSPAPGKYFHPSEGGRDLTLAERPDEPLGETLFDGGGQRVSLEKTGSRRPKFEWWWAYTARPPTPFRLVSRVGVDPGPSVHESREHGFRLTVPDGSLPQSIGPITVQGIARVIKCENNSDSYLTTTVANCKPAGIRFSVKPLFMDFFVEYTSNGDISDIPNADDADTANDIMSETPDDDNSGTLNDNMSETSDGDMSETFQVLVRENEAGGWRKIDSQLCRDQWGTFIRAEIHGFSTFGFGERINPAKPFHTRACKNKDMIGVANATNAKAFFVLVPVAFDTERTVRASYTGRLTFGGAGATIGAAGGSEQETGTTSILLPAGLSPSYIQVLPQGSFDFATPTGASQGMLLVATLSPQPQAAASSQPLPPPQGAPSSRPFPPQPRAASLLARSVVVSYYGKFETPKGKTRVLLSGCLECGHLAEGTVHLNSGDSLVNMVMVMAGLGVESDPAVP